MAFTAKGFQLYSRDITLTGGRVRKHYFFSRHAPEHASPEESVPAGSKVGVNRRTSMPYLKKVAASGARRKKPSRSRKKTTKVGQPMPAKKKRRKAAKRKSAKKAAKRKAPKRKAAKRKAPKRKAAKRKAPKKKASRKKAARKK
jgi:hypothetical protein